jgi:hypothetical protein
MSADKTALLHTLLQGAREASTFEEFERSAVVRALTPEQRAAVIDALDDGPATWVGDFVQRALGKGAEQSAAEREFFAWERQLSKMPPEQAFHELSRTVPALAQLAGSAHSDRPRPAWIQQTRRELDAIFSPSNADPRLRSRIAHAIAVRIIFGSKRDRHAPRD